MVAHDSSQCHLLLPKARTFLWGRAVPCAGRVARLFENSTISKQRARGARADEASALPKVSDIAIHRVGGQFSARSVDPQGDNWAVNYYLAL